MSGRGGDDVCIRMCHALSNASCISNVVTRYIRKCNGVYRRMSRCKSVLVMAIVTLLGP